MENQWRSALTSDPPKEVTDVQINVKYEDGTHRPTGFDVKYKIGDKKFSQTFSNVMKGAN
jgi:hypothetical protein